MFIVTVRLPKNPKHDPHNKVTGPCPLYQHMSELLAGLSTVYITSLCTDTTGEHHSFVYQGVGAHTVESVRDLFVGLKYHVTRVEEV